MNDKWENPDKETYIKLLDESLSKKLQILNQLYEETLIQEKLLNADDLDFDAFEKTISVKGPWITELEKLDSGFEKIYSHVKDELAGNKLAHRDDIRSMQKKIEQITAVSAKLQANEQKNHDRMEMVIASKRQGIKEVKVSSKTANTYYKNYANLNVIQPAFIDKKQ